MNRLLDFLGTRLGGVVWYGTWAAAIFGLTLLWQHLRWD